MELQTVMHPLEPFVPPGAEFLILGSFPSIKSREIGFYYGHPQNRFWRVLAAVFASPCPTTVEEKKSFLATHKIALWDVIASCEIRGSSDASIRNALPNDIASLTKSTGIRRIFINGKIAGALYTQYIAKSTPLPACVLPSTSPANAAFGLEQLTAAWSILNT